MELQSLAAGAIVAITLVTFLVVLSKKSGRKSSCGHNCGCHKPESKD